MYYVQKGKKAVKIGKALFIWKSVEVLGRGAEAGVDKRPDA